MAESAPTLEPPYGARDPRGMVGLIEALADHVDAALARTDARPWSLPIADPDLVAVGGMGGSAIAAELTGALTADRLPRPWLVVRDRVWPACVTSRSLAVLSSCSGNTAETLALDDEARRRAVPRLALASGGELAERARADGIHTQSLPSGMPPRAALFHAWVPVSRLPAALGWTPDPGPQWREAVTVMRAQAARIGPAAPESDNPAKRLARAVHGRRLVVYSGPGATAAVGVRWRQQLNENAKLLAHSASVPELNHNEIVGWQRGSAAVRDLAVILLRDREDPADASLRLDLTADYTARQGAAVHEIHAVGESRIARLASLVQFGDHLSLYLALLGGVDPTDITSIDEFKRRLAQHPAGR